MLNNKKVHWFFSYVCNGKFSVFWVLYCGITCKCIDRCKVYNRLVSASTVKTAIDVKCLCVSTSKKRHYCRAFSFLTVCLFACATINRVNLAFKTTIIEDTHLTQAVIPFKVEENNSLIILLLQTYEKKIAEFPFLLVYNFLHRTNISYKLSIGNEK